MYPEAHIWPYYTGIRPFPPTSFQYPAELDVPVVAMVTRYRERKGRNGSIKKPAHTVILSDPMYPKPGLTVRQAQLDLHRRVAEFMYECTALPGNYEYVQYRPRGTEMRAAEAWVRRDKKDSITPKSAIFESSGI